MPRAQGLIPLRGQIGSLGALYSTASRLLTKELLSVDLMELSDLQIMNIQKNVNDLILQLNLRTAKWARRATRAAYKQSQGIADTRLTILGMKKSPDFSPQKHRQTIDGEAGITSGGLIIANESIKTNVAYYFLLVKQAEKGISQLQAFDLRDEEVISGLIDDAVTEGASRGDLQQLIRIHFKRRLYDRKFINISGRNYDMIKYAKMVARTRLRIVQSKAIENSCAEFEADLVEISSHGTTCESQTCQQYEGQVYSINGSTPGYPRLPSWPPYHPNCEHSAAPTSVEAIEWRKAH